MDHLLSRVMHDGVNVVSVCLSVLRTGVAAL
jgi:hypothetical protein